MGTGIKMALAYLAAVLTIHAAVVLFVSYVTLDWQSPLDWQNEGRGWLLAFALWAGLFAPIHVWAHSE